MGLRRGRDAEDLALAIGEPRECLGAKTAERLAAAPARLDETGGPEAADVPAHERLREPDVLDQVPDRRVARREAADDPEPVDVGERLVDDAQLTQVIGLVDDRGERRANPGAGGAQARVLASTRIYINGS